MDMALLGTLKMILHNCISAAQLLHGRKGPRSFFGFRKTYQWTVSQHCKLPVSQFKLLGGVTLCLPLWADDYSVFYGGYIPRPRLIALNAVASLLESFTFDQSFLHIPNVYMHMFRGADKSAVVAVWSNCTAMDLTLKFDRSKVDIYDTMANLAGQSSYKRPSVALACRNALERACVGHVLAAMCDVCAGQQQHRLRTTGCSNEDVQAYCGAAFAVPIPASRPLFLKVASEATATLTVALRGATAEATFPGAVTAHSVGSGNVNVTLTGMSTIPLDGIVDFGSQLTGNSKHFSGLRRGEQVTLTLHSGAIPPSSVRVRVGDEFIISSSFPVSAA